MLRSAMGVAAWVSMLTPAALIAQDLPSSKPVSAIHVAGAREIAPQNILEGLRVKVGDPLPDTPQRIGASVLRQYKSEGYTFAHVKTAFDESSGVFDLDIDEGVIDRVVFHGVNEKLAATFVDEFALRAGDVFNSRRARQALEVLLRPTRGAVSPGRVNGESGGGSADVSKRHGAFDLVERNGERTLLVELREPAGRFRMLPDLGEREDWFSSVDGFVPSLGMGIAVFDHDRFNHTFISGHLSYKTASERGGYALGFERPLFGTTKLYVGGELHDLTATDDQWQVSSLEASVAASAARRSFRDYYRRRGIQINGAVRLHPQVEALVSWRDERQEPLATTSDFSLWNGDEPFRPNIPAQDGRLNALLVGMSVDGRGFDQESLEATYRRHQLDTLFGERLDDFDGKPSSAPSWRIDWSSEFSEPGAFGSDFDFRRHIVSARSRLFLSPHQVFAVRGIGGWSEGTLPPQRQFSVGGVGSVHGYDFKEQIGDSLALLNLEYELGWQRGFKAIGFFDVGRATERPIPGVLPTAASTPWLKGVGFGLAIADFRVDFGYKVDDIPSSLSVILRFGRTF